MHIFADQISKVSLSNYNLRIELTQKAADNASVEVGTLIIPVSQANNFVNGLANGLKRLDAQIKEQAEQNNNSKDTLQ
ncbi:MAG TPA: hypothetical protein VJ943_06685 [Desulfotignum sp.]|nr:hypothetical protein [Desulfotignum sp.]